MVLPPYPPPTNGGLTGWQKVVLYGLAIAQVLALTYLALKGGK